MIIALRLNDWAETAETSSFSYLVRSEPKSFDIELEGSPENIAISLDFDSTRPYCQILYYVPGS